MENENENIEDALACTIMMCAAFMYDDFCDEPRKKRTIWMKDFHREREERGAYKITFEEFRLKDPVVKTFFA